MNEDLYTDYHDHPIDPTVVEVVAYQRKDQGWDVFVFEPEGSCPELESSRIDAEHIFVRSISDVSELERVVDEIEGRLGTGYQQIDFSRETGARRTIQMIMSHLQRRGGFGMQVRATLGNEWILSIRKKDIAIASEVALSNL